MAKSLRSKWKRKMRAIKRISYGAKELQRLKTMLAKAKKQDDPDVKFVTVDSLKNQNAVAEDGTGEVEVVEDGNSDVEAVESGAEAVEDGVTKVEELDQDLVPMEVVGGNSLFKNGQYPVWLSKHKIKRLRSHLQKEKKKLRKIKNQDKKKVRAKRNH